MAWDDDNQYHTKDGHSQLEFGTLTLGSDGTVECTTRLNKILSANATHKSGMIVDSKIKCDCTITSGAVTFADSAGEVNSGAIFTYELRGYA